MANDPVTIRITFKSGPAQPKNLDQEYEIASAELDRLISEMRATGSNDPIKPNKIGTYEVKRWDSTANAHIQTRLILRFEDVLYIG